MNRAPGQMEEVVDHECEDDDAAPRHGPGRKAEGQRVELLVPDFARRPALQHELNRGEDVNTHGEQQCEPRQPEELPSTEERIPKSAEALGVVIERLGPLVNFQISYHVADDEAPENEARRGHDDFLAYTGVNELEDARHFAGSCFRPGAPWSRAQRPLTS